MGLGLGLEKFFVSFLVGRVEQIEWRHRIGVQVQNNRQGELGKGDDKDDGVWDKLEQVNEDPLDPTQLIARKLEPLLSSVEIADPLSIRPEILGALHEGVLHLLEEKLGLQPQSFLIILVQLGLQLVHLLVLQQMVTVCVGYSGHAAGQYVG